MGKPKCEGCGKTKGVQFYDKAEVDLCPKCAEANRKPKGKPKMTDKMRLDFVKKHGLPIRYCDSWLVMTPKRTFQIRCGFRAAIDFLARETAKYKAAIRAERKGANRG